APALEGPYRLRGAFDGGGESHEIRIATARPEGDGSLRFKALLRASGTDASYALEGRLIDIMGRPHVDADLSARLPLAGLLRTAPGRGATPPAAEDQTKARRGEPAFELKAGVKADAAGATFSDLALSFEQDGRPQLISGKVTTQWRDDLTLEMSLSSRWLDLDPIAGTGEDAGPLDSIIPLALKLRDLLPSEARSHAFFSIDQANVGREAVSGV